MKKQILLLTILFSISFYAANAQNLNNSQSVKKTPVSITWSKCFGGTGDDEAFSICESDTNEILLAGYTYSSNGNIAKNNGDADWLAMDFTHTTTPKLKWEHTFGGSKFDKGRQITPSYNHKSYVEFGTSHSRNGNVQKDLLQGIEDRDNWWVVKFDEKGKILKEQMMVGTGLNGGRVVIPTSDNGYMLMGWSTSNDHDFAGNYGVYNDGYIFKVDSNLNIMWKKHYGGSNDDAPIRMIRSGNFYYMTGFSYSNDFDFAGQNKGNADLSIWKIDTLGNVVWAKLYGGSGVDYAYDIQADYDGNILAAGYTTSNNGDVTASYGNQDGWFIKVDAQTGKLMWQKSFGGEGSDNIKRIVPMPDHGYVLLASSSSGNCDAKNTGYHGSKDVWLIRTDSNRNIMWSKMFGGSGLEEAIDIMFYPNQGYMIFARSNSNDGDLAGVHNPANGMDVWAFFVTDSSLLPANTSQLVIKSLTAPTPVVSSSFQVYPTLTTGMITVQSLIPMNKTFSINIVSADGKLILTKNLVCMDTQINQQINLSNQPKGIYFIQIQCSDGTKQTQRIVLQ
jgi:hypothetical protein